jgi:hypothetical protein
MSTSVSSAEDDVPSSAGRVQIAEDEDEREQHEMKSLSQSTEEILSVGGKFHGIILAANVDRLLSHQDHDTPYGPPLEGCHARNSPPARFLEFCS